MHTVLNKQLIDSLCTEWVEWETKMYDIVPKIDTSEIYLHYRIHVERKEPYLFKEKHRAMLRSFMRERRQATSP